MPAIKIDGLVKQYGDFRALDGFDLEVPRGAIFGFLGPNGAGKTTTTRILVGLSKPTNGSIELLGSDYSKNPGELRSRIGYLPDVPAFYEWMSARDYLMFIGEIFAIERRTLKRRVGELLEAAGLGAVDRRVGGFSRGMKQRLGIAQAFLNDPDVLFLDEPTSALDPIGRKEVLDMIESLAERKTVFFSTHILGDVERVCDRVAIIHKGVILAEGDLEELRGRYTRPTFTIELDTDPAPLMSALDSVPWVSRIDRDGAVLTLDVSEIAKAQIELPGIVASLHAPVRRMELKEATLEDIFVDIVEEKAVGIVAGGVE
ncbi:MAG: ABC transporter ATP-binding protein [Candidatus Aquicultorales bacterium]